MKALIVRLALRLLRWGSPELVSRASVLPLDYQDVLVIQFERCMSHEHLQWLKVHMNDALPGQKVVVFDGSAGAVELRVIQRPIVRLAREA